MIKIVFEFWEIYLNFGFWYWELVISYVNPIFFGFSKQKFVHCW